VTTAVAPELESDQEAGAVMVRTHNGTSSSTDTAGVIAPPPLIYLSALGIGFGLDAVIGSGSLPSSVAVPVGAASIITGAGLVGSFVRAFQRARTPFDPYTPSEAIVTDGPYRLTRNPGYLGDGAHLCRDRDRIERALGARAAAGRDRGHRPRRHRA
jgi:protein-S-isoprenylcysteine O-methyltransferase Ste14